MALSQVYTAVTNDTITAARWNNEFGNLYNNGTDVAFPLTKSVSAGSFNITTLADPAAAKDAATRDYVNGPKMFTNLGLTATVGANALTINLVSRTLGTPSSTDTPRIAFRNSTLTTGDFTVANVTAATSLVVSSGSTLGTTNGVAARLYITALNNAGTVELGIWNPVTTTGLVGFPEDMRVITTAEGGAGAADSAGVMYSTTARSNVAHVVLGYIEITEATAGTWATAPTVIQLMGPGVRRTGDIVQVKLSADGAVATGSTTVPADDTIPQNTEGDQYMSLAITPTNAINRLTVFHTGAYASSAGGALTLSLFQDTTANALAVSSEGLDNTGTVYMVSLFYDMAAGTTSATTLKIRAGTGGAGTTTFNGAAGARRYAGTASSFLRIVEVFA